MSKSHKPPKDHVLRKYNAPKVARPRGTPGPKPRDRNDDFAISVDSNDESDVLRGMGFGDLAGDR